MFELSKKKEGSIFNIGILELAIALYPIIAGYGYGSFQLAFGFLLIVDIFLINRKRQHKYSFGKIYQYMAFIVVHCAIWLLVMPSIPSYFVNSFIAEFVKQDM